MSAGRDWRKKRHWVEWGTGDFAADPIEIQVWPNFEAVWTRTGRMKIKSPYIWHDAATEPELLSWLDTIGARYTTHKRSLKGGALSVHSGGTAGLNDRQYIDFRLRFPVAAL